MTPTGRVSDALAAIESELQRVWAPPDESSQEPVKVRAAMLTYVVVTPRSELDRWVEAADQLTASRPGRALVVCVDGRLDPGDLKGDVSAICRADGAGSSTCSDRIALSFGAMAAERAASVIGTLALPELPMVVELAPEAPAVLARSVGSRASRIVVDTQRMSMASLEGALRGARAVTADRGWVRSYSFRELLARLFDDEPAELQHVRRVTVSHRPGTGCHPHVLVGWLASRLGWSLEPGGRVRGPHGDVTVTIASDPRDDVEPGAITLLRLETEGPAGALVASCARAETPGAALLTLEGARPRAHRHALGFRDETWVAERAIDANEGDAVYAQALSAAIQFAAAQTKSSGAS